MDITIRGRNVTVTDRFESYVDGKTEKIATLLPKTQALEVRVSRTNDRSHENGDRVEITLIGPGPTVRAESTAGDKYAAFDIAYGRVLERVRRAKDKQKIDHKRGKQSLSEISAADFAGTGVTPADASLLDEVAGRPVAPADQNEHEDYNPVVIRSKTFPAKTMTAEEAVDQMELVGHDFFLFLDSETEKPSVVYRRRGWNYGVISLESETAAAE